MARTTSCFLIYTIIIFFLLLILVPHEQNKAEASGSVTADDAFDHLIVSFPKSGRTWLRLMLAYVFEHHFELRKTKTGRKLSDADVHKALIKLRPLADWSCKVPLIEVDHMYSNMEFRSPSDWHVPAGIIDRSMLLLIRDPRDACVSNWFQKRFRHNLQFDDGEVNDCSDYKELNSPKFKWRGKQFCDEANPRNCSCFPHDYTLRDFIHEPHGGFESTCHYMAFFYRHRHLLRQLLVVRYEDLKSDPVAELRRIMLFFGLTRVRDASLQYAVSETSFDAMRSKEMDGTFGSKLVAGDTDNPLAFKTRAGIVGGFREFLDESTQDWMADTLLRVLPPEFGYTSAFVNENASLGALYTDIEQSDVDAYIAATTHGRHRSEHSSGFLHWRSIAIVFVCVAMLVWWLRRNK